ncbi:MAG: hypothetical protein HPY66_1841 [Firmicutes bacterium]|nr:hypothetical protein [Bacillota bacterium]
MDKSISKLYLLNLDPLLSIIQPLYSNTGCPAKNQPGIIRSLILMLDQKHHGITSWAEKVAGDRLLCAICGFHYGDAPSASSYYDFIKRLWKTPHKIHVARTKKLRPFKAKPRKKLKAGQKMYKNSLLPVTVPRFIPVPPITVQRSVIAKNMVSTTASAQDVIPTRMPDGVGIATGNSGSIAITFLTSLLPTVLL